MKALVKDELGLSGSIEIYDKDPETTRHKKPIKTLTDLRDGSVLHVKQVLFSVDQWTDLTKQMNSTAPHSVPNPQNMKLIEENMSHAYEHHPETMLHEAISMLYIKVHIEQCPIIAFVDTGAQMSILTMSAARRCGYVLKKEMMSCLDLPRVHHKLTFFLFSLVDLVDKRFGGIAKGIGSAPIVGRIHSCPLQLSHTLHLASSLTIIERLHTPDPQNTIQDVVLHQQQNQHEEEPFDMILGLDLMRRFAVRIELGMSEGIQQGVLVHGQLIPFIQLDPHRQKATTKDLASSTSTTK